MLPITLSDWGIINIIVNRGIIQFNGGSEPQWGPVVLPNHLSNHDITQHWMVKHSLHNPQSNQQSPSHTLTY